MTQPSDKSRLAERPPHLFAFLSREEWQTCFALAFLDTTTEYADSGNLGPYHVPGSEATWESAIIAAVRYLALEHDVAFDYVVVRPDDEEILPRVETPPCLPNLLYLDLLALGKLPDIPNALATAVRLLHRRAPDFNTDALESARADVDAAVGQALERVDPDELAASERVLNEALSSIGVQRLQSHLN